VVTQVPVPVVTQVPVPVVTQVPAKTAARPAVAAASWSSAVA